MYIHGGGDILYFSVGVESIFKWCIYTPPIKLTSRVVLGCRVSSQCVGVSREFTDYLE